MPAPVYIAECKMLNGCIELYFKQSTALKNKLHSLQSMGIHSNPALTSLKRQIRQIEKEIHQQEIQLEE